MAQSQSIRPAKLRSIGHKCATTARETIYTCPKNYTCLVTLLFISNSDTANRNVTVEWWHASESTYYTIFTTSVSSSNYLQFSDGYMVLNENDRFHITAGAANVISAIISVEELYAPITHT